MTAANTLIAEWAERNPKIRRVWVDSRAERAAAPEGAIAIALELQPVADSEETLAVWLAHCEEWRRELCARTGRVVDLEWLDPDEAAPINPPRPGEANTLVYESAR